MTVIRRARFLLVLLLASALPSSVDAATRFIDFAAGSDSNAGTSIAAPWKRAPGMTGVTGVAASYTPAPGDTFIFKGSVTWTSGNFPWTIRASGSAGNPITYTTDHTWFAGGAWSQPVFDGGGTTPSIITSGASGSVGASYVTLNDVKIANCGQADVSTSGTYVQKCVLWFNSHDLAITNSTLSTYVWISVFWVFDVAGSYDNFTFSNNDCSKTSGCLWWATATDSVVIGHLTANHNVVHDFDHGLLGAAHGDGLLHAFAGQTSSTSYFHDSQVCDNRFYGNFVGADGITHMTAFVFFEGGQTDNVICNNDMSFSPVQASTFGSLIAVNGYSNTHAHGLQIYGNSMANIGTNAMSSALEVGPNGVVSNILFKNNILSGMQYGIYCEAGAGCLTNSTFDYNDYNTNSSPVVIGSTFYSLASWQATGQDAHTVAVDPSWVSAPGNEHLQSGSLAINKGTNLSGLGVAILNSDYDGSTRGTTWDIGAFEFASSGAPPGAPTQFSVSAP